MLHNAQVSIVIQIAECKCSSHRKFNGRTNFCGTFSESKWNDCERQMHILHIHSFGAITSWNGKLREKKHRILLSLMELNVCNGSLLYSKYPFDFIFVNGLHIILITFHHCICHMHYIPNKSMRRWSHFSIVITFSVHTDCLLFPQMQSHSPKWQESLNFLGIDCDNDPCHAFMITIEFTTRK